MLVNLNHRNTMPLENDIQALTASINALTSAITAAAKAAPAVNPAAPIEEAKPEPKPEKKAKADKPATPPPAEEKKPEPAAAPAKEEKPAAPAATLPDLTATIQKALKPLLSQGKLKEAQAILKKEGAGAANFGTIARENQQAVLDALETLAVTG